MEKEHRCYWVQNFFFVEFLLFMYIEHPHFIHNIIFTILWWPLACYSHVLIQQHADIMQHRSLSDTVYVRHLK